MNLRRAAACVLVFAAGLARISAAADAGPAGRDTAADRARREGVLLLGNGAEPQDLDPQVVTGIPEFHVIDALFEGLVAPDPRGSGIEPAVAQRWETSADGRVWTFHLRPEARWSNGEPLTAGDFVRSYERLLHPAFAGDYAYLFAIVEGAEDFHAGRTPDFGRVGFRARDPHTLEIRLAQPVPYFLQLLAYTCWRPVPLPTIEASGGTRRRGTDWTRPDKIVTNGPFRLERWIHNQFISVVPDPNYWDAKTVRLRGIRFLPVENQDTEERMFRTGQLHKTNEVPPGKIATYRAQRPEALRLDPQHGVYFYRFNTKRPPFDDARVRRAFTLALDRRAIVEKVVQGGQRPALHFTPPGTGGYELRAEIVPSADEARALLAAAGFPGGAGFPTVELLHNTSESHRLIAEAAQEMWRAQLGVRVELRNEEWKVYLESQRTGKFALCRAGWVAVYDDPSQFLEIFTAASGNNHTGWTDPAYDAAFRASLATFDRGERARHFQTMEELLAREAPVAPLYFYTRPFLLDPAVRGWGVSPLDQHPYKYVGFAAEAAEGK